MTGLILWGILIFIIACAACPGFTEFLAVAFIGAALFIFIFWLLARLTRKH